MIQWDVVSEPYWDQKCVFIVGGGPSLKGRDLSRLRERGIVLGVNRAADHVPCDATFSLDRMFLRHYRERLQQWAADGQEVYGAIVEEPWKYGFAAGAKYLRRRNIRGLSDDPGVVACGGTSGYGAINLAALKRARTIVLLGYDLHVGGPKVGHWHSGYHWNSSEGVRLYPQWLRAFSDIPAALPSGVEVVNANPDSAIRCFPVATYESVGVPRTAENSSRVSLSMV